MQAEPSIPFEGQSSLLSRALIVIALLGTLVVLVQTSQQSTDIDPLTQASVRAE